MPDFLEIHLKPHFETAGKEKGTENMSVRKHMPQGLINEGHPVAYASTFGFR